MSFDTQQAAAARLAASLENADVVICVEVAAATLFIYDYFTTLSSEVDLVWRDKWGAGKILFLMGRYRIWPELVIILHYGMFKDVPSPCRFTYTYCAWSVLVGVTVGDAILVLRTWAVWGTSRRILFALIILLCATTAINAYYLTRFLRDLTFLPREQQDPAILKVAGENMCAFTAMGREIGISWIAVAGFELVIFLLTAIKLKGIAHAYYRTSRLVSSIYRDGILYFITLSSVSIANVIFIYTQPPEYIILLALMQGTLHSILTCKLILHIRAVARDDETLTTSKT